MLKIDFSLYFISFILGGAGAWLISSWGKTLGLLDRPNKRSSHSSLVPKARVFMGDVGSILLGFVFAGMVVYISKIFLEFVCLAGFLFPFYADELTTMMIRIRDGEKLSKPHRRHLYQLLANEYQIPHWKVSVGYGFAQLLIGISILLIKDIGYMAVISALVFYFGFFMMVSFFVRKKNGSKR